MSNTNKFLKAILTVMISLVLIFSGVFAVFFDNNETFVKAEENTTESNPNTDDQAPDENTDEDSNENDEYYTEDIDINTNTTKSVDENTGEDNVDEEKEASDKTYEPTLTPLNDTDNRVGSVSVSNVRATAALASSYRSPYTTSVKNQNPYGTCWSFASIATLESAMIKAGLSNTSIDLSERALAYFTYNTVTDPLGLTSGDTFKLKSSTWYNYGGNCDTGSMTLAKWIGGTSEGSVPYNVNSVSSSYAYSDIAHVGDIAYVDMNDRNSMKNAINSYGNGAIEIYYSSSYKNGGAYYYNGSYFDGNNHAVTIVGWNDNYSRNNFKSGCQPAGNGAYLCKNSWGSSWGEGGYFWMSYYDKAFSTDKGYAANCQPAVFMKAESTSAYKYNYQYDGTSSWGSRTVYNGSTVANVYTVQGKTSEYESLDAVSIMLKSTNVNFSIQIYKNPTSASKPTSGTPMLATPLTGSTTYAGYRKIKLNNPVTLKKGDKFAVAITVSSGKMNYVTIGADNSFSSAVVSTSKCSPNQSFTITNGAVTDLYNNITPSSSVCARVKAFTNPMSLSTTVTGSNGSNYIDLKVGEDETITTKSSLTRANASVTTVANSDVTYSSSNDKIAKVSSDGVVTGLTCGEVNISAKTTQGTSTLTCVVSDVDVKYRAHVQNIGWQNYVSNGMQIGTTGRSLRMEALDIELSNNNNYEGGIRYRAHVQDIGWQTWQKDGTTIGTSGKSKRVEAMEIELYGEIAEHYDVYYRTNVQDYGITKWAKNGEPCGSAGKSKRMESMEVILVAKESTAPTTTTSFGTCKANKMNGGYLKYRTHVQDYGWQGYVNDGYTSGTVGKSKRLEAIDISLTKAFAADEGGITYSTHIQNIGWQDFKSDGEMSGTSHKSLRLEAIKIKLTGDLAEKYDVYYRTHIQEKAWSGWAKNGQECGSAGYGYRLEGIQIVLVEKGSSAPGTTANHFY